MKIKLPGGIEIELRRETPEERKERAELSWSKMEAARKELLLRTGPDRWHL